MMNNPSFPMNPMPMMGPWGMMPIKPQTFAPPLYVGDLDENIHEEELYEIFSKYGPLHFVRIMRDSGTGRSRGYAFVNFVNPRDAETAKQYAQYQKVGRKHIRIMFKRNVREMPPEANVFVKNIDPNVTVKDLHGHFLNVGNVAVLSAKINTDNEGKSLGYGYVQFEKPEDAQEAIKALNNSKLKEKELELSIFVPRDKRPSTSQKRNIYVRGLPSDKDEAELNKVTNDFFSKFGTIESKMISKHKTSNLYSAFICFKEQESAQKAFTELSQNPVTLPGATEPLYVNWHQAKVERQRELNKQYSSGVSETNLFVKNLKLEITQEQIKNLFNQFGNVTSVAVREWTSKTGKKKANFGFIAFATAQDATNAMNESANNQEVKSMFLPGENIYIQRHQSKEKRHQFLVSERKKRQMTSFQNMGMHPAMYPTGFMQPTNFRRQQPYQMMPGGPNKPRPQNSGPFGQKGPGGMQNRGPRNMGHPGGMPHQPQQHRNAGGVRPMGSGQAPTPQVTPQVQKKPESKPVAALVSAAQLKSRIQELLGLDHEKQRQILGEMLFPKIQQVTAELAPKITGMLIDLDVQEVIELLEDNNLLLERIEEAKELLTAPNN